jgi:hypothetical protein
MSAQSAHNQEIEGEWDESLKTYPVVPAPKGFSNSVMMGVYSSAAKPKFHLSWFDYALTVFTTSMFGLILILGNLLPREWTMLVRFQALVLWKRGMRSIPALSLMGVLVLVLVVIAATVLFWKRPYRVIRAE